MKRNKQRRGKIADSIFGRVSMVMIYTLSFSAAMLLLFLFNTTFPPIILKTTIIVAGAAAAGIMSRQMLKKYGLVVSFFVAVFTDIFVLGMLHPITSGYIGINILDLVNNVPDWDRYLQIALGVGVILMTTSAWKYKLKIGHTASQPPLFESPPPQKPQKKRKQPGVLKGNYWKEKWAQRPKIR
ncbi:MAG: hypothetical protein N2D54_04355, partial [Chloroflexota bacterium]